MRELDQPENIVKAMNEYAKNPKGFLLLSGKNGTGKSYCAMAVYERNTPYKLPQFDSEYAIFITQADLNALWIKDMKTMGNVLMLVEEFAKTKLLVVDDLGTRTPTEGFMDFLYSVADKRYTNREKVGTIITTNLNSKMMKEKFGDAFTSRVASGKCFRYEGNDRRFAQNDF